MKKRAILLVPGLQKRERFEARNLLVTAIDHHAERFRTRIDEASTDANGENFVKLIATPRAGAMEETEICVFEAYWNDLAPDFSNESPWSRFLRASRLMGYWAVGGLMGASFGLPSKFRLLLVAAALILLMWYLSVAMVLADAIVTDSGSVPEWFGVLLGTVFENPEEAYEWLRATTSWGPIAFLLLIIGAGRVEIVANVADFAKTYLGNELVGENKIGLRTKMRKRAVDTLDHIFSRNEFDEVVVVAHSFGGPIAIDALAEFGNNLPKTHLFTWGTPMAILIHQEPKMATEIEKLQTADPALAGWTDIHITQDLIAGPMPILEGSDPEAVTQVEAMLSKGRLFRSVQTHEDYYRCQEAIEPLLSVLEPKEADPA